MSVFDIEYSKAAYRADFAFYTAAVLALAAFLLVEAPAGRRAEIAALALLGLAGWSLIEYALHRFVLHGVQPFRRWHLEHHRRPRALLGAPTILSAALIAALVFLPIRASGDAWQAGALTWGVMTGYLAYGITHHALHHWRFDSTWLRRRKHWHALHHHGDQPGCYGVTSAVWDHLFGTAPRRHRRGSEARRSTSSARS
jgi:sterol desaturase/sphingolipid hydroxylase (fatty acid hydroxylase superfamily)